LARCHKVTTRDTRTKRWARGSQSGTNSIGASCIFFAGLFRPTHAGYSRARTRGNDLGTTAYCLLLTRYPRHQGRPKILMDRGTGVANPNTFFWRFFEYDIVISNRLRHRDGRLHQAMISSQAEMRSPAKQAKCLRRKFVLRSQLDVSSFRARYRSLSI
jgi:hypothetical protein